MKNVVSKRAAALGFAFAASLVTLVFAMSFRPQVQAGLEDWQAFRSHFISNDGRVIDDINDGISHSEGQGYAMFLATYWNDRQTFQSVWTWTRAQLQVRGEDQLFAWRWQADDSGSGKVTDLNNASDGDILIAWALCRAYFIWKDDQYLFEARAICSAIRQRLVRESSFGILLLPGAFGFDGPEATVVNLSYWVFPAFADLHKIDPVDGFWNDLSDSGIELISKATFGPQGLPPDWLEIRPGFQPADDFEAVFGYNAIRIPLYLGWVTNSEYTTSLLKPFTDLANRYQKNNAPLPAKVAVGASDLDAESASAGMAGIMQFATAITNSTVAPTTQPVDLTQGYYSAVLQLLSRCAIEEAPARKTRADAAQQKPLNLSNVQS